MELTDGARKKLDYSAIHAPPTKAWTNQDYDTLIRETIQVLDKLTEKKEYNIGYYNDKGGGLGYIM